MSRTDSEEIGLYHGYLNSIHAYLQGFYSRVNVWRALSPEINPGIELTELAIGLEKVIQLYKGLWEGKVVDLISEGESADAQLLCSLTTGALYFFDNAPGRVVQLLKTDPDKVSEELLGELIGFYADQVYSRQHFVKGLIAYGNSYNLPELADRWMQHTSISQKEIQDANTYFALASEKTKTVTDLFLSLRENCLLLPGIMKSKAADIRNLEGIRLKQQGYQVFGISKEQGQIWKEQGFAPLQAAYWKGYTFKPEQAAVWLKVGFQAPAHAASYGLRGIKLSEAAQWANLRVSAAQAARLQAQGQTPDSYRSDLERQSAEGKE